MTANEIISFSLKQLGRTTDVQTMDFYKNAFIGYINEAVTEIADKINLHRTEAVGVVDGEIDMARLERPWAKVLSVSQDGKPISYTAGSATGTVSVKATGEVQVTYKYIPERVEDGTDIPETPLHTHNLIPVYVVACERSSQEASVQRGANVYFERWQAGLASLRTNHGTPDKYKIVNKW